MKKLLSVIVFLVVLIIGGAAYYYSNLEKYIYPTMVPPAAFWVDTDKPLDEQTVDVEIGDRSFRIPKAYVQSKLPLSMKIKDSVYMTFMLPDFTSVLEHKMNGTYKQALSDQKFASMLIRNIKSRPQISKMIENLYGGTNVAEHSENGLYRKIAEEDPNIRVYSKDEAYLELSPDGEIISFVKCSPDTLKNYPRCNHTFVDQDLLFRVSYNKKNYFHEWQKIRAAAISFIDRYELQNIK